MEEDVKFIIRDLKASNYNKTLIKQLEYLLQAHKELQQENHNLKEKLENYIPRRRVRRIYKQVKKILEQDGIVDDLESEVKDEQSR